MSIRNRTEFAGNAVAIDPPRCECTDCQTGDAVPLDDSATLSHLAEQAVAGRRLINRTYSPLLLDLSMPEILPTH